MELGDEGKGNLMKQIRENYILPEFKRRQKNNSLPKDFKIYRCLIKFPIGEKPLVQFNREIVVIANVKRPFKAAVKKNDPLFLHEISSIEDVERPKHNGKEVAFIFLHYDGQNYKVIFDFTPNFPEELKEEKNIEEKWRFGKDMAKIYNEIIEELVVKEGKSSERELRKINLWPMNSLLPYPFSKIIFKLKENKLEEAEKILGDFCSESFLEERMELWFKHKEFEQRKILFEQAFKVYKQSFNHVFIPALVPQIEGIITDFLHNNGSGTPVMQRKEKMEKFQDLVDTKKLLYKDKEVQKSFNQVFENSFYKRFDNWIEPEGMGEINRHKETHGKYEPETYSKENALRLFLMFDTLYEIIKKHKEG